MHRGAGAYICGEETGLLDSLEGKRGNPRLKPPFPANQGLYQGPTLINNVETLSTVPHIIEMGGEEYAKIGVENSTGTKLVSVSGNVQRPGNYEIELGMPSREIIYDLAGGPPEGREVKLWFPGGSSLAGADRRTTSTSPTTSTRWPRPARCSAPARSSSSTTRTRSSTSRSKLAKFYAHESCGKCTPCREGTNWTVKMLERDRGRQATPMDLDIMASVQEQIIGNCLCVLGDAMAMPIGSMVEKFRAEFEAHIEAARASRPRARSVRSTAPRSPPSMPRPAQSSMVTLHDRRARGHGARERDAGRRRAKYGDVEIPVFCYEPKLGQPVGACRMCLVEIEGIPKLQTGCSTPVKDGMVVHTQTAARARRRRRRSSSSCSSTTRSTARSATRAASARCRTSPSAGAAASRASSSPSATSRSRSSCRR